jgi:hypothetical protein
MIAMRQIIEDPQDVLVIPPEFRHKPIEVIFMTIDPEQQKLHGTDVFEDYQDEKDVCESQVDALIELITRFTEEEEANRKIYKSIFDSVVSELKETGSPDEIEGVTNAWEFLGVINYHGGDHGLYDFTVSELRDFVNSAINSLTLNERLIICLTNGGECFEWDDSFKGNGKADLDHLIHYITKDEPFYMAVDDIADAIQSNAPKFSPYE